MTPVALALAERAVPRYTSYPTAPHFTPAVNAAVYDSWLDALPESVPVSLYIHVPYCAELCLGHAAISGAGARSLSVLSISSIERPLVSGAISQKAQAANAYQKAR